MSDNVKNAVITETDKEIEWEDKEIFDILIEFDDEVTKRKIVSQFNIFVKLIARDSQKRQIWTFKGIRQGIGRL